MLILHDYRVRQRDHLLNIARALTEQLDLTEVLRRILEASAAMLAGEIGLIALRGVHNDLHIQAAYGVPVDQLNVFNDLLEDFEAVGIQSERLNFRTRQIAKKLELPLRQVIALPMIMSEASLGIILVFRTFSGLAAPDEAQILQSFADQAAIAVHNARLYDSVNREKQRLDAILQSSADGIMILDDERRIQQFNRALSLMTGWRPEMAIGRLDTDVIRWLQRKPAPEVDEMLQSGWNPTQALYAEGEIERLDGLTLSVGITYALIHPSEGYPASIVASVRDITNFRKAEQMKDTFISVVSHELKTPVALIKGYAGTLRREDASWQIKDYQDALTVIEEEADRLTELIENLLAASKLQAESMKLDRTDVQLDQLATLTAERFRHQSAIHQIVVDFPPDFPIILGDETRLRQVLDNLVSNAIKYSPDGGMIRIRGSFNTHTVSVAVQDQGVGIPTDQQPRIFERFYRVDDALSRTTQGTGLGLYLARAVIEAHSGTINVESQMNQGSTFTFSLPR